MLGTFRRLDLTNAQWQQVRDILQQARQARRSAAPASAPTGVPPRLQLLDPGSAGYASAVQALEQRTLERIQRASQVQQQLYRVLTPQQQTRLTQWLAQRSARGATVGGFEQRRAPS